MVKIGSFKLCKSIFVMLKLVFENVSICILLKLRILLYDSKNDVTQRNLISCSNWIEFTLKKSGLVHLTNQGVEIENIMPCSHYCFRHSNWHQPAVESELKEFSDDVASHSVISMKRRENSPMLTNTRKCCSCTRSHRRPWSGWSG